MNDDAPFVRGSATSEAAARSVDAAKLRARVFDCVNDSGSVGRTCDEIEEHTGLTHQTASARVRELVLRGDIIDSHRTRKTRSGRAATVWIRNVPVGFQQRLL